MLVSNRRKLQNPTLRNQTILPLQKRLHSKINHDKLFTSFKMFSKKYYTAVTLNQMHEKALNNRVFFKKKEKSSKNRFISVFEIDVVRVKQR